MLIQRKHYKDLYEMGIFDELLRWDNYRADSLADYGVELNAEEELTQKNYFQNLLELERLFPDG